MAANTGRDLIIYKDGTAIAGVRTATVAVNKGLVDITSKDDEGFRKLAAFSATQTLTITVEGVLYDDTITSIGMDPDASPILTDITIEDRASGGTISGDFGLESVETTGPYEAEETYSFTLQSSGKWTVTA